MSDVQSDNADWYVPTTITAARIGSGVPSAYRLVRETDGALTLQGLYQWTQGLQGGMDWIDIPTIDRAAAMVPA